MKVATRTKRERTLRQTHRAMISIVASLVLPRVYGEDDDGGDGADTADTSDSQLLSV